MILYHGSREKFALAIGQAFSNNEEIAKSYAGSRGMVMEIEIDLHGLEVQKIAGFDRESNNPSNDSADSRTQADVLVYDDVDPTGKPHRSWRIMSEDALRAVRIVKVEDNTEDSEEEKNGDSDSNSEVNLDQAKDDQDDNSHIPNQASVFSKRASEFTPERSVKFEPDKSAGIASAVIKAIHEAKQNSPLNESRIPVSEMRVITREVTPAYRHTQPVPSGSAPRPNQSPWSNTDRKPVNAQASGRLSSPQNSVAAIAKMCSPQNSESCPQPMTMACTPGRSTVKMNSDDDQQRPATMRNCYKASMRNLDMAGGQMESAMMNPVRASNPMKRQSISVAMQENSREIKRHEERHSAALRDIDPEAKPKLIERQGPDGRKYAISGEVNTDTAPVMGNPEASEFKADAIYRSAMSDQNRSQEDNEVGRKALALGQRARQEKHQMNSPDAMKDDAEPEIKQSEPQREMSPQAPMESPNNSTDGRPEPHKSKMKMPLLPALAAIARGALATGGRVAGAVAKGSRGLARSGYFSKGWAKRIRSFGRGASRARVGMRRASAKIPEFKEIQSLSNSFGTLDKMVTKVTGNLSEMAGRLRNYSPEIAQASAQNRINQIQFDMQNAKKLGKPLADYTRAEGGFSIAQQAKQSELAELFLPLKTAILDRMALMVDLTTLILKGINYIGTLIKAGYQWAEDNVPLFKRAMDGIGSIEKVVADWARKNQQVGNNNLADFFNIKVPAAGKKAQINGPVINMAIPFANPLPFQLP